MEEILKINGSYPLSSSHKVFTDRGLLEAKDLKFGDNIQMIYGYSEIVNVIDCGERPNAPILGETNPYESFSLFEEVIANKIAEGGKEILTTGISILDEVMSGGLPLEDIGKVCGGNYDIWNSTNPDENFKIFERLIEFGRGYENKEI